MEMEEKCAIKAQEQDTPSPRAVQGCVEGPLRSILDNGCGQERPPRVTQGVGGQSNHQEVALSLPTVFFVSLRYR